MYRMEQLKAKEQLFSSIQFLTDLVQMIPSKRLQHESHGGDVELREGSPGLHEMPGVPGLLELEPDSTPLPLQNRQGKKKVTLSVDSNVSSSGMGASDGIPCFNDLEKRMLKEVTYSSHSIRGLKGTPFGEASGKSEGSEFADADEMQPVAPSASAPAAPATERDPPMLQVSKAKTDFSPMKRRGSTLQHLTRHSQNQILATSGHHAESPVVCEIFVENIGVSLWLNCSNSISLLIILLNLCHLVLAVVLYAQGHQRSGEQWTAMSLLLFSAVAVLLLQLVKRSLYSEDLNRAVQQLDDFVKDCGHGLNWSSVAQKYWCRFVCLWATLLVAFVIEQALEVWAADGFWDWSVGARVRVLKAVTSFVLFAVSSAVVMNGAYFQFNLLLGLGKTLDCWCSDLIESQDFTSGIESWNSIQALLKCVGREINALLHRIDSPWIRGFFRFTSWLLQFAPGWWHGGLEGCSLRVSASSFVVPFFPVCKSVCKRGIAKWKVSSSSGLCEPAAWKWSWHWSPLFGAIHFWQCCWLHHPWGNLITKCVLEANALFDGNCLRSHRNLGASLLMKLDFPVLRRGCLTVLSLDSIVLPYSPEFFWTFWTKAVTMSSHVL